MEEAETVFQVSGSRFEGVTLYIDKASCSTRLLLDAAASMLLWLSQTNEIGIIVGPPE